MPENTSKIIFISTFTIGGVIAFVFLFFSFFKKRHLRKKSYEEEKKKENSLKSEKKTDFQVTTSVSIEFSKRNVSVMINDISTMHNGKSCLNRDLQHNDEEKLIVNNSTNDNADKTTYQKETVEQLNLNRRKASVTVDHTLMNIVTDLKNLGNLYHKEDDLEPVIKRRMRENLENQTSLMLDKPEFVAGNLMNESDGYLEESDSDLNKNPDNNSDSFFEINEKNILTKKSQINENNIINFDDKIKNLVELKNALHEKKRHLKFRLQLEEKFFLFKNKNESQSIIKSEEFLYILKHLYNELHTKLVEMNDAFDEERRRYFQKDERIYVSIIKYNLQKKEEFFLSVVSNLMGRISITQDVLDKTFHYYFNLCDKNLPIVIQIKECYEEVYNAGLKFSLVPKNLTKNKLKKIYMFQLELYEKFSKKSDQNESDVIDIMVIDHVYAEYGLDSECIKAAAKKYQIQDDPNFSGIIQKIVNYQNNSFN